MKSTTLYQIIQLPTGTLTLAVGKGRPVGQVYMSAHAFADDLTQPVDPWPEAPTVHDEWCAFS